VAKEVITVEQHSQAQSYILPSDKFCVLNIPSFSISTVKLAASLWLGCRNLCLQCPGMTLPMRFTSCLAKTGSYALITGNMVKENWDKIKSLQANEEVELEEMEEVKSFANQLFDYARFFQRRRGSE